MDKVVVRNSPKSWITNSIDYYIPDNDNAFYLKKKVIIGIPLSGYLLEIQEDDDKPKGNVINYEFFSAVVAEINKLNLFSIFWDEEEEEHSMRYYVNNIYYYTSFPSNKVQFSFTLVFREKARLHKAIPGIRNCVI